MCQTCLWWVELWSWSPPCFSIGWRVRATRLLEWPVSPWEDMYVTTPSHIQSPESWTLQWHAQNYLVLYTHKHWALTLIQYVCFSQDVLLSSDELAEAHPADSLPVMVHCLECLHHGNRHTLTSSAREVNTSHIVSHKFEWIELH